MELLDPLHDTNGKCQRNLLGRNRVMQGKKRISHPKLSTVDALKPPKKFYKPFSSVSENETSSVPDPTKGTVLELKTFSSLTRHQWQLAISVKLNEHKV